MSVRRLIAASHISATVLCLTVAVCAGLLTFEGLKTISAVNATLTNINRPCKGAAGADACGTLAQVNKTAIGIGDVANASAMQVQQTGKVLTAAAGTISGVGTAVTGSLNHLNGALDGFKGTTNAAAQSLTTLTEDAGSTVQTANASLNAVVADMSGIPALVERGTIFTADADTFLNGPLTTDANNIGVVTHHFGDMSADADLKFHALLFPPPCKAFRCHLGEVIRDVQLGSQFVEPAYYLKQMITGEQFFGTVKISRPVPNPAGPPVLLPASR